MSTVITRVTILITHIRGLITPLRTTPEPPSSLCFNDLRIEGFRTKGVWGAVVERCLAVLRASGFISIACFGEEGGRG